MGMLYAFMATLISPVLSDMFGFTVGKTAMFFIGVSLANLGTSFIQ